MILCCGEALIDLLPLEGPNGKTTYFPCNGGSIYNTCISLARLGDSVGFLGGISTDFFGQSIQKGLEECSVSSLYSVFSDRPSTVAFVKLDGPDPEYIFLDENSAGRMIQNNNIPELQDDISALHFGSISLIHEPAASTYENLAKQESPYRIISLDPNIRPSQITDAALHLERLERMIDHSDIIKVSLEDLDWMAPNLSPEVLAMSWLERDVKLVVVTRGQHGASAFSTHGQIDIPAKNVKVADTIGAGDTFMAGMLHSLASKNKLSRAQISHIDIDDIKEALDLASTAAAITVSRQGANPPWQHEMPQD